ncbi:unnamed protein product [Rhizophagus irregularis]|nr:unnamed protein product [Rhizophagus irregularis]
MHHMRSSIRDLRNKWKILRHGIAPLCYSWGSPPYGSNIKQKVSDELYARAIEIVNDLDTPEIEKTFTEFNDKLTAKVDTINNIEEACSNEFGRINVVIENLQNEINQHYAVVQRTEFDQQSMTNDSEAELGNSGDSTSASTNSSPSSSSSGSSNLSGILDITSDIKIRFKQHFD